MHHGVRIQDSALVAAAVLSHRYITDRFLPDKAIDLMDEAASKLRIEIDSLPTEIDVVERRISQLEIERQALTKETDAASKERLAELEAELADLREQSSAMKAHWQNEKEAIAKIQALKEQIEKLRQRGGARGRPRTRRPSSATASCPSSSARSRRPPTHLAELQSTQTHAEGRGGRGRHRRGRQPSGPASRSAACWKARCRSSPHGRAAARAGRRPGRRPVAVANAIRRTRAGLHDPNRPIGSSSSSAPPAWARPSWPGPWPSSCSTTSGP